MFQRLPQLIEVVISTVARAALPVSNTIRHAALLDSEMSISFNPSHLLISADDPKTIHNVDLQVASASRRAHWHGPE